MMTDKLFSRTMMIPAFAALALTAMSMTFAAPARSSEFDEIVKQAAKENTLVFWASTPREETVQELVKAFNQRFGLNIKVTRVAVSAGDVTPRMLAEKKGRRHTVDVSIVSEPAIKTLNASDIIDNGIVMTGGTSQLRNFPELVLRRTGVKAQLADDALYCVAKGSGIALDHLETYKKAIIAKR